MELEMLASGKWLLQAISILPKYHDRNYAKDLLSKAEKFIKKQELKK
tara:strand:- start:219 stop:359 length:141 start_codon:yes stop_codon:yes gene_type:complete